jgi:hypothetical protein
VSARVSGRESARLRLKTRVVGMRTTLVWTWMGKESEYEGEKVDIM